MRRRFLPRRVPVRAGLALISALAVAVLLSGSPQNAAILAVAAFLVSPLVLPMLAAKLLAGLASVNSTIKDFIYG